jgi:hypothetical protein
VVAWLFASVMVSRLFSDLSNIFCLQRRNLFCVLRNGSATTSVAVPRWQPDPTALGGVLHLSESIAMRGRIGMFLISSFLQRSGRSTSPISVNPELTGARRLDGFSCQS